VTTLARSQTRADDDPEGLRSRLTELESLLTERTAGVDRVKSDLEAYRIRYHHEVGLLHEQLDELELAIAEAEVGEISIVAATNRLNAMRPPR